MESIDIKNVNKFHVLSFNKNGHSSLKKIKAKDVKKRSSDRL
jgi:hypothetical protein